MMGLFINTFVQILDGFLETTQELINIFLLQLKLNYKKYIILNKCFQSLILIIMIIYFAILENITLR